MPIISPTIYSIDPNSPLSAAPQIFNNNFSELSGLATDIKAGLVQYATDDDMAIGAVSALVVSPALFRVGLNYTGNIKPVMTELYNIGLSGYTYNEVWVGDDNKITVSGGILYINGVPNTSSSVNLLSPATLDGQAPIWNTTLSVYEAKYPADIIYDNSAKIDGSLLTWNNTNNGYINTPLSAFNLTLDNIADVINTSPVDNNILVYSAASSAYINSTLNDLKNIQYYTTAPVSALISEDIIFVSGNVQLPDITEYKELTIKNYSASSVTVSAFTGTNIETTLGTFSTSTTIAGYNSIRIVGVSDTLNWYKL